MIATTTTATTSTTTINTEITMPAMAPDDNCCTCSRSSLGGGALVAGDCDVVGISLIVSVVVAMKASTN